MLYETIAAGTVALVCTILVFRWIQSQEPASQTTPITPVTDGTDTKRISTSNDQFDLSALGHGGITVNNVNTDISGTLDLRSAVNPDVGTRLVERRPLMDFEQKWGVRDMFYDSDGTLEGVLLGSVDGPERTCYYDAETYHRLLKEGTLSSISGDSDMYSPNHDFGTHRLRAPSPLSQKRV